MWIPKTAQELHDALGAGTLTESHSCDFKRELSTGGWANRDLAGDLASMAVDGGVIYLGVDEDHTPAEIKPLSLRGLPERIEQIARSGVIDPALTVVTRALETEPGRGVLLGIVPPSPDAPHQVRGRYRGRAGVTNVELSDAEVRRIIDSRRDGRERAGASLDTFAADDPLPDAAVPRMFLTLDPVIPGEGRLFEAVERDIQGWMFRSLLNNNGPLVRSLSPSWSPDFQSGVNVEPRADGWGIAIGVASLTPWDGDRPAGMKGALDLEVTEDGGVRLYCCAISWSHNRTVVWDQAINGLALRAVMVSAAVAEATGYLGEWHAGILLAHVAGTTSGFRRPDFLARLTPYTKTDYRAVRTVSSLILQADAQAVVRLLLDRFNRALSLGLAPIPE